MAKKYLSSEIVISNPDDHTVLEQNVSQVLSRIYTQEAARFAFGENPEPFPFECNIPQIDSDENINWDTGVDPEDDSKLIFTLAEESRELFAKSSCILVPSWQESVINQEFATINNLHLIVFPGMAELIQSNKLRALMQAANQTFLVSQARKAVRSAERGDKFQLSADPVGMLLAASTKPTDPEKAYNQMFPFIQALLLANVDKVVKSLHNQGKIEQARQIKATYHKDRMSKTAIRECLSSQSAAEYYFPGMINKNLEKGKAGVQWDNILALLVKQAPLFRTKDSSKKDMQGKQLKDVNGNPVTKELPQSPAIFAYWLNDRYTATSEISDIIQVDFSNITL